MANKGKNKSRGSSGGWIAFFGLFEGIVDKFGWPGALLVYGAYFVEKNATIEQKHSIIEMYVLGKGINYHYPVIALGAAFVLAFLAQWAYYRKKFNLMKGELKRLAEWKTEHQERKVGGRLHHSGDVED